MRPKNKRCYKCDQWLPHGEFDRSPARNNLYLYCRNCRKDYTTYTPGRRVPHHLRTNPNPSGLCQCGCGLKTPIAQRTNMKKNHVRGYPTHFALGHHMRKEKQGLLNQGLKCCTWCKTVKPLSEFYHVKSSYDGFANACRVCTDAHSTERRINNRESGRALMAEAHATGCVVCGETDSVVLDFHHLKPLGRQKQSERVSALVSRGKPLKTVRAEIAKCVVICANCHRRLHAGTITLGNTLNC